MKKIKAINFLIVATLIMLLVSPVSAAGPTGSWVTGITCQNLSPSQAMVLFQFYREGVLTSALNYFDTIPANGTLKYFTPNPPPSVPSPFSGSVAVSSDQSVICNFNLQSTGTGTSTNPYRMGTASGLLTMQVNRTMYAPQIDKVAGGTWNSYMVIQNSGLLSEDIEIHYYDRNTGTETTVERYYNIAPNTSKMIYPELDGNLPNGFYSAVIIGTQTNSVTVSMYNSGTDNTTSGFNLYDAIPTGGTNLIIPRVVYRYYGYNSGISVMNVSDRNATVYIDFTFKNGVTYHYQSPNIIKQYQTLMLYTENMGIFSDPNNYDLNTYDVSLRTGRASVYAKDSSNNNVSIVGIVNMDNRGGYGGQTGDIGKSATSNMGVIGQETNDVFFPQLPKKAGNIFTGGLIVANATGTPGSCDFTFYSSPIVTLNNVTLPANGLISLYMGIQVPGLPDGFNGSAKAHCNPKVFGVGNFSADASTGKLGDSYVEYNAYNQ